MGDELKKISDLIKSLVDWKNLELVIKLARTQAQLLNRVHYVIVAPGMQGYGITNDLFKAIRDNKAQVVWASNVGVN